MGKIYLYKIRIFFQFSINRFYYLTETNVLMMERTYKIAVDTKRRDYFTEADGFGE